MGKIATGQRIETTQGMSYTNVGRKGLWTEKFPGENVSGFSNSNEADVLGLNEREREYRNMRTQRVIVTLFSTKILYLVV